VFFFGVFWKRLNAIRLLVAMVIGFIVGLFACWWIPSNNIAREIRLSEGIFLLDRHNINFQYFSILITSFPRW